MSDQLHAALDALGLADLAALFRAQDIDADMLPGLTEPELREIGLSVGQRTRFFRALREDRSRAAEKQRGGAERRQLTTLFCDLVGSSRIATLLDPEDLRDVIQGYQSAAADIVRAHGGYVAYSQGDGLMAYFGFPQAGEDDPERAIRAGLELAAAIGQLRTAAPDPLAVRIGIATGTVVVSEADDPAVAGGVVVGETPNIAARLQEAARPGEVVVSDTTRRLCGARFDYEFRGAMAFKGFDDPMPVHAVVRETDAGRFATHALGAMSPLVGRDAELAGLRRLWSLARAGSGGLALVGGEPGIGKSRLVHDFLAGLGPEEMRRLDWHSAAHLSNRPMYPVVREIEAAAGISRDMAPEARQAALAAMVAGSPGLGPGDGAWFADLLGLAAPAEIDAQGRARRILDVLVRRVVGLAGRQPLVILLEDAHWSDAATLDLIGALAARLQGLPLLLIVTHRPGFAPPWTLPANAMSVQLAGIDAGSALALSRGVAQRRALPAPVVEAIVQKAGGIPLFVEELTKTLLDAAEDGGDTAAMLRALQVPSTLQDSLMARLDRLGPAKEVAQLGSVIGREFTPRMLRVIAPGEVDVMEGLRRLCASGLAAQSGGEAGTVRFHHALVQDTAYEALLKKRRRDIHRGIAEAMLAGHDAFAGAEPEIVARHCAVAGLDEPAMQHWLRAGRNALDRAANHAAMAHLHEALAHLGRLEDSEDRTRAELQIQMVLTPATMQVHGWASPQGDVSSRRVLALAKAVGDAQAEFTARWSRWSNHLLGGRVSDMDEEQRHLSSIAEAQGLGYMRLSAHHVRSYGLYTMGRHREVIAAVREAERHFDPEAERIGLRANQLSSFTSALAVGANSLWYLGDREGARAAADRVLAHAEALNHRPNYLQVASVVSYPLMFDEDWPALAERSARLLRMAEDEGLPYWMAVAQMHLVLCNPADPGTAAAVLTAVMDQFLAMGSPLTLNNYEPRLAAALLQLGDAATAERRMTARILDAEARGEANHLSEVYRLRGEARRVLGDRAGAAEDFGAAIRIARDQPAIPLIAAAERALAALGDQRIVHATGAA